MATYDKLSEMVRNSEKAKLAILKELANKNLNQFELADTIRAKYYNKDFNTDPFIQVLKKEALIEETEGKYRIIDKSAFSKLLSEKKDELEKVLSMDFGKGDLAGQLTEQETYILRKVLSSGNSITISDLYDYIFDDIDHKRGSLSGYSRLSYGKKRAKEITNNLVIRNFLKANGSLSIPDNLLLDLVMNNLNELLSELKYTGEKIKHLLEENSELSSKLKQMTAKIEELDLRSTIEELSLPELVRNRINKAYSRIDQNSFSEAIINCYLVSETLVKVLFNFLYPDQTNKRIKHENKLKKIWNAEEREKHEYPGIRVVASLLAVILWYRNKMAAHTDMTPTKEAARICVVSLIQALIEFKRLGINIKLALNGARSIKDLTEQEITNIVKTLISDQLISFMPKIFDEILMITTWSEVKDNRGLFDFIRCAIKEREKERIQIFERFFEAFFPTTITHGRKELLSILADLVEIVSVKNWIIENGDIDKLISELVRSRSFDMAGINTKMILEFLPYLSSDQLNTIIDAAISNDQIHLSLRAKPSLDTIMTFCRGKVKEEKLEELHLKTNQ